MLEHPVKKFVGLFAVFTAAVLIVSYGAITSYFSGYLNYFGINIRYIDFWPHLPDFMIVSVPIILTLIIAGATSYLVLYCLRVFGKWLLVKRKSSFLRGMGTAFHEQWETGLIAIFVTLSVATFTIVYGVQTERGAEMARNQTQFIRVGPDREKVDILIYQNGGLAFVKAYDKETKKFEDSFRTVDFSGLTLENLELVRK